MDYRLARATRPEDRFVDLFQDVFGPAAAAKLEPQIHFLDIYGRDRYIDFALVSLLDRFALEIDGETYHHPAVVSSDEYEDQLLRQNSLIHLGWRVLRWSDRQIQDRSEEVKEQLSILLDQVVRLTIPQEHLPCKRGALVELHEHQMEALAELKLIRERGDQIALLSHAVGSGKTTVAVEDARSVGLRTLFLAHTYELVDQAYERFTELWRECPPARLGTPSERDARVVVGTVQYLGSHLADYRPDEFGYIVVDEAHHANSKSYQAILRYFDPEFFLGLTATPDRADGQNALEVFRQTAHRMDLETAVRRGILCDVRAFRVATNVDLRRIRFNGNLYNRKDLEQSVSVPSRNELIVKTYAENVPGRSAVVFCVSVEHAEEMARLLTTAGFTAKAVSGRLGRSERRQILSDYNAGMINVLCACDVLNEGWDAPRTEVLLLARPTLSKVIYQQQLGRGMRTYTGKDFLVIFDFVDVFSRHNQALSIHRLLKRPEYRPGVSLFNPDAPDVPTDLPLHLWSTDYEPIDVFDWQDTVEGMVTATALSRLLRKSDEWVNDQLSKGKITPDEVVDLGGGRTIPYFRTDRLPELRETFHLVEITEETLYEDFVKFMADMNMTFSYKPVWFHALLDHTDEHGKAPVIDVTEAFHNYYLSRQAKGLPPERPPSLLARPDQCSDSEVRHIIGAGPFYRFSRLDYVSYAPDRAFYQIPRAIWKHLTNPAERVRVEALCEQGASNYFRSRLDT